MVPQAILCSADPSHCVAATQSPHHPNTALLRQWTFETSVAHPVGHPRFLHCILLVGSTSKRFSGVVRLSRLPSRSIIEIEFRNVQRNQRNAHLGLGAFCRGIEKPEGSHTGR
jgi:hypothetical protein